MNTLNDLQARRDRLYDWLEQATAQIERGKAEGADVEEAENKWIAVLRQYEAICEQIRVVAGKEPAHTS